MVMYATTQANSAIKLKLSKNPVLLHMLQNDL